MEPNNPIRIAVCTDFTSIATHAFHEALRFARLMDAEIHLIHIINPENETMGSAEKKMVNMIKGAEDLSKGVDVKFVVAQGNGDITESINEQVTDINPDYFVVGYEVKKGMDRFFGPNIMKIVRGCKYPVIAIKENETLDDMKNILFPINLNGYARQKTVPTIQLALDLKAKIQLVGLSVDFTEADAKKLKIYMKQLTEHFEKYGVEYTTDWLTGDDDTDLVIDYANQNDSDMIAKVFEHDPSMVELFTGNEDEKVIAKTNMPLFIVKSHEYMVGSWSTMRG
jgi:nucleotide-binding universal stress UspA family protein